MKKKFHKFKPTEKRLDEIRHLGNAVVDSEF